MLIKKDENKELEKILEQKDINEQAKNLLQGILYKIEVSYKDYKIVKGKRQTEEKYIKEILENIKKRCNKITVISLKQKFKNEEIQKQLQEKKFYIDKEIICYPIEEKILYAIEMKSRHPKILNNKYEEQTIAISDFINSGKIQDRVEVLRDFNGWSWTTIKNEIENIEANLIYQMLQIILGEEFLNNWCEDKDGIIDYLDLFSKEIEQKYGKIIADNLKELLIEISIENTSRENKEYAQSILNQIKENEDEIKKYEDSLKRINEIIENKKILLKELNNVEQMLKQKEKLKQEYERINENFSIEQKIFNINVLKKRLTIKKQQILEEIKLSDNSLKPSNYLETKDKLIEKKQRLQYVKRTEKQKENALIEFIENFLKCFEKLVDITNDEEEILRLIYQFRYFLLLPFNQEKSIKDVKKLESKIINTENKLTKKAIKKKVLSNVPIEVMKYVYETRIIVFEKLFYKITKKDEKQYIQLFDENISEEKFEITPIDNAKINKKIRIFT